ncbi:class D sortase [Roseburia sp. 831b]|uniref:class D sortase n=1 Tax=Roseburia sp. 831b TaxID=1261635 RepID=UPI000950CA5F|nr:class D sortase [Roseburia sp. 831b]WVK74195.1 class D sortase [Roseburia sp. 831b]
MSRRKVFAGICIVVGVLFFVIPIVYHYTGMRETDRLTQEFEQKLEEKQEDETEMEENGAEVQTAGRSEDAAIFAEGDVIAILEIESIGIRYPVVEGCSSANLNKAIGHLSETGKIGEKGNCVLAGHNGSRYGEFFTKLNQVATGDKVTLLDTEGTLHTYEVTDSFVVGPYDNSIKTHGDTEELTLFTCAERGTKRFVVKCVPVRAEGAYGE